MEAYQLIIVAVVGLFVTIGAIFNWDWFIGRRQLRFWGSKGRVRIVNGIIGIVMLAFSVLMLLGVLN